VPGLGILQVGDRPDSSMFIAAKVKKCEGLNFKSYVEKMPSDSSKGVINRAGSGESRGAQSEARHSWPRPPTSIPKWPLPAHIGDSESNCLGKRY